MRRLIVVIAAAALLAGCEDTWFGDNDAPPLPGERVNVLSASQELDVSQGMRIEVVLPQPERVPDWPLAGGFAPHAMHHLEISDNPGKAWSANVGSGGDRRRVLMSQPVVANGVAFAMDAWSRVSAFSLRTGDRLWRVDLTPEDVYDGTYGGGVGYEDGKLFVTTGYNQLIALAADSGQELWRIDLPTTVRGAPTIRAGRVLVVTIDNQTLALSAENGDRLWTHSGIIEGAAMVGGTSPAVDGNMVVVTYSSGEVFALRIENGAPIWTDTLAGVSRIDQVATMTDIRGLPVISNDRVYVASNSDTVAAIDTRTGRRVWTQDAGSIHTPWIAGDFLYVLTNANELVCFEVLSGEIVWVTRLQEWRNEEYKRGRIIWTRPVLASDRLIVASGEGDVLTFSPYTGKALGRLDISEKVVVPPIVADGVLLLLTEDGYLTAYR